MKSSTWLKKRLTGRSGESGDDADQSRSALDVDRQDPEEHNHGGTMINALARGRCRRMVVAVAYAAAFLIGPAGCGSTSGATGDQVVIGSLQRRSRHRLRARSGGPTVGLRHRPRRECRVGPVRGVWLAGRHGRAQAALSTKSAARETASSRWGARCGRLVHCDLRQRDRRPTTPPSMEGGRRRFDPGPGCQGRPVAARRARRLNGFRGCRCRAVLAATNDRNAVRAGVRDDG
jgi:hypothetical protein